MLLLVRVVVFLCDSKKYFPNTFASRNFLIA